VEEELEREEKEERERGNIKREILSLMSVIVQCYFVWHYKALVLLYNWFF